MATQHETQHDTQHDTAHPQPDMQPGDRVRTIQETWGEDRVPLGAVGTVIQPPPCLAVAFDHDPDGDGTGLWAIFAHQLAHLGHTPDERDRLRRNEGEPVLFLRALSGRHDRRETS